LRGFEWGLAGRNEVRVQLREPCQRKEHLAPDLDEDRHVVSAVVGQLVRDRLDGPHVESDVPPPPAVTAGCCPGQPAVLVGQIDGQSVDLELGQPAHGPTGVSLGTVEPGCQFRCREDVVEAEQAFGVLDRRESGGKPGAADSLRGRLRRHQRRKLLLDRLQLPQ